MSFPKKLLVESIGGSGARLTLVLALSVCVVSGFAFAAGTPAPTGAKPLPEEEYLKVQEARMTRSFSDENAELYSGLPAKADLSAALPEPGQQGLQLSCSGWAVAYAVKSFQENREHGWGFTPDHLFSPAFHYNLINRGVDQGTFITDALQLLTTVGAVPLTMMPYSESDFTTQPTPEMKAFALNFAALGYRRVNFSNIPIFKSYLAAGDPVLLQADIDENFYSAEAMRKSGNVYRAKGGAGSVGHFMVAVGYDDAKGAIKILNSFGKEWGEGGYGWVSYEMIPEMVEGAFVVYDRPTPAAAVARLWNPKDAQQKPASAQSDAWALEAERQRVAMENAPPANSAPAAIPGGDMILVVPEEGGIVFGDKWLRLSERLDAGKRFFSSEVSPKFAGYKEIGDDALISPDFLKPDEIGRMHFIGEKRVPVYTNLGVTLGTPKSTVRAIYRNPDHADELGNIDTYFYHAAAKDWGGLQVINHASLSFRYDKFDKVSDMSIGMVFKKAFVGEGMAKAPQEQTAATEGTKVDSMEGGVSFTVPTRFTDINKSVWPGIGVGYFIKNPTDFQEMVTVKVFDMPGQGQEILETRMQADLTSQMATNHLPLQNVSVGDLEWKLAADPDGMRARYYAYRGERVYQVYIFSGKPLADQPWAKALIDSFEIKK